MQWRAISRLFGILLMLYSLSFAPSLALSLGHGDGQFKFFGGSLILTLIAGSICSRPGY